jgi:hypothetical protein
MNHRVWKRVLFVCWLVAISAVVYKYRKSPANTSSHSSTTGSYQDVKVSKLMLDAHNNKPMLSDYGVQRMKALGEDGFVKWHSDTVAKMKTTKELVEKNLLSISKNLRKFYKLPSFVSETGKRTIAVTYGKDDIKKIKNKCSLEKLQKESGRRTLQAIYSR